MDTLDFAPIIKTKAIVVKSAVDKQHDTVIMIAEIRPEGAAPWFRTIAAGFQEGLE